MIRKCETKQFNYAIGNYLLLTVNESKIQEDFFSNSYTDLLALAEKLIDLTNNDTYFKLYGIWHGEYRTDFFDLDGKIVIKGIAKYVLENSKQKSYLERAKQLH